MGYNGGHTRFGMGFTHDKQLVLPGREALLERARRLMNSPGRNERQPALDRCFGLTLAEQVAPGPLGSLYHELCPQELAERTVRCLCEMAQKAQTPAPAQTPRLRSQDLEDFWLCLLSNILMM